MSHYNTTAETGPTLATYQQTALKQEDAVLALFRLYTQHIPGYSRSPSEVHSVLEFMYKNGWLLTSIRRAMTDLTEQGLLERTPHKVKGPHGRSQYRWRLA